MMSRFSISLVLTFLATLSGFSVADTAAIDAAIQNPARSENDRKVDPLRKPDEVLSFLGIEPGMAVLDVFAGGGYYSEILSYVVGPSGKVTMYNNMPWADFVKKVADARLADNRLPNVKQWVEKPEALMEGKSEYDAAIFIMGMHDIYYADPENGWVEIDKAKFLKGIFTLLKPGAVFGVIDHNGEAGSDPSVTGKSVHRVDPAVMIADLKAAGFVLEAESDLLANPDDDYSTSVFLPENRYRTDRSLLKFRKPE